jgi:hypothetical protein
MRYLAGILLVETARYHESLLATFSSLHIQSWLSTVQPPTSLSAG